MEMPSLMVKFLIVAIYRLSSSFKYIFEDHLINSLLNFSGLVKNQKLPANILTPTTKAEDHDVPISPTEVH